MEGVQAAQDGLLEAAFGDGETMREGLLLEARQENRFIVLLLFRDRIEQHLMVIVALIGRAGNEELEIPLLLAGHRPDEPMDVILALVGHEVRV